MNRVLILSDSLALPRSKPETCIFEDTWPQLLQREGYKVHQVSIGGATSSDLRKQVEYHKSFDPEIVIVQVGIVDCAPRFMTKLELDIVRKIPGIGRRIISGMNKDWIKKARRLTYIKPSQFQVNVRAIKSSFPCEVIFLGIIPATPAYDEILPGVGKNIGLFNSILSRESHFISVEGVETEGTMNDHHHLNKQGHAMIYAKIIQSFKTISGALSLSPI